MKKNTNAYELLNSLLEATQTLGDFIILNVQFMTTDDLQSRLKELEEIEDENPLMKDRIPVKAAIIKELERRNNL